MLAKTLSYGINGLDAYPIQIEVDVAPGLPSTTIVGLPDNAVKESKERVRSAIKNSGYKYPVQRITVNLSPADVKKEGPSFDVAIAMGLLAATHQIDSRFLNDYVYSGELSLDGTVQPISGVLSIAMALRGSSFKGLIVPSLNAAEAALANSLPIFGVESLNDVILFLVDPSHKKEITVDKEKITPEPIDSLYDFADVRGQWHVKRGLEIAAAGGHNVLMLGPPGSGKSMLAKRLNGILPNMTWEEMLETTKIHSVMGLLKNGQTLVVNRPFRSPHHTTSDVAVVGGGSYPKPGEVTLSHHGILFLDELPEFNRDVLEALRQPLEDFTVTISRASKSLSFPARFIFVAAMNPCPCGWLTDPKKDCQCSTTQIQRYMAKISGPLLDRIDIHLEVPALPPGELMTPKRSENSSVIKIRTTQARQRQLNRLKNSFINANAYMNHNQIEEFCKLEDTGKAILKSAMTELNFSARAHDKILKVARTIADLDEKESIETHHLAEAIQYRSLDRNG